jgi:hypothetical protein
MAQQVGGNVYVRASVPGETGAPPLFEWSPTATESCTARVVSLDEFRKLAPAFEADGRQLDRTPRTIFQGPDLGRYELREPLPVTAETLPADVRKLLGWSEEEGRTAGAFPWRR